MGLRYPLIKFLKKRTQYNKNIKIHNGLKDKFKLRGMKALQY